MLKTIFDIEQKLVHLQLGDDIEEKDFISATEDIQHYLSEGRQLAHLVISVEKFKHWEEFSNLITHLEVGQSFEASIETLAVVTDNAILDVGAKLSAMFTAAKIQIYSYCEYDQAMEWVVSEADQGLESVPAS